MSILREILLWVAFIGCFFLFAILGMSIIWLPFLWTLAVFPLAGCFYFATKLFDQSKRGDVWMTKPKENWDISDINGLSDYELSRWITWTLSKRYGKRRAKRILKILT